MPEGHTIHRLARDHEDWFAGRPLSVTSPQGRFAAGARRVDGRVLEEVAARGKHLFYTFDGGRVVHVHLGLVGRMSDHDVPAPPPRSSVRMRLAGRRRAVDLVGPMTCELVDPGERDEIVARLGPDPLSPDADPERFWSALQRRTTPVAGALLDQSVVAGIGNVYRAEALFALGVDPRLPARELDRTAFDELWELLVEWLGTGVRRNRIVTVPDGDPRRLYVYGQDDCLRCGSDLVTPEIGGRTLYACPSCQGLDA